MRHTLKNASSHLTLISEESDEIQEPISSKMISSLTPPFLEGKWVTYETTHSPLSILGTVQHKFFPPLSSFSGKMSHIIKNASSHLLQCLERENEMQTNDVLSVVFWGNMLN